MLIPKDMPDVSELVLIKINKIMPHGAYCKLVEYNGEAYLPIAEVASGWIKNIHEFIKEGQQDVAKVIFVDRDKRSVDVSLKKASSKDRKQKISDHNTEKRAEGIFNKALASNGKTEQKQVMITKIPKTITTYTDLINEIAEGKDPLKAVGDEEFSKILYEAVKKSIKPKVYTVSYNIELNVTNPSSGVSIIKDIFKQTEALGVEVLYLGAPHYRIMSTDNSFPKAEVRIREVEHILEKHQKDISYSLKSNKGVVS